MGSREKMIGRIMVMLPQSMRAKLDAASQRRAISRSAYIRQAVSQALEHDREAATPTPERSPE